MMDKQEIIEYLAKWLYENKNKIRSPQFYNGWEDEINASPYCKDYMLTLTESIYNGLKEMGMVLLDEAKEAWYILDEIAVRHSAKHTGSGSKPCPICDRAEEAMKLLPHPNHEECQALYNKRLR